MLLVNDLDTRLMRTKKHPEVAAVRHPDTHGVERVSQTDTSVFVRRESYLHRQGGSWTHTTALMAAIPGGKWDWTLRDGGRLVGTGVSSRADTATRYAQWVTQ